MNHFTAAKARETADAVVTPELEAIQKAASQGSYFITFKYLSAFACSTLSERGFKIETVEAKRPQTEGYYKVSW